MGEIQIPSKTKIKAVARFEIEPRDFDETAKFYRRLGFQLTIRGDIGKRTADLKSGEVRLRFIEAAESGLDRRRGPFHRLRICLRVSDLPGFVADLRGKGMEVEDPGAMRPLRTEIVDPNGVRILLEEDAA
jgi:hypothetical protein